ncbi:MAG: hypothetical protein WBF20_31625, partial [Trebonia sp.]|uniref:hypothetical protein n=2 Tax=Trebonia sp. TaxID=2767075 RepID=UPI003BE45879
GGGAHAAAAQAGPAPMHVPPEAPAPEHARNLFSSLQSGWLRSRETDDTEHDATPQGGTARHDEET